jgi:hypothetical protein
MLKRFISIGALAAVGAVGCDRQDASPFPTANVGIANTGTLIVKVLSDTSPAGAAPAIARTGLRVNLYLPGNDTTAVRQILTGVYTTKAGTVTTVDTAAIFAGLPKGTYIIDVLKPQRALSVAGTISGATSRVTDTVTIAGTIDTVKKGPYAVRLGARITGAMTATYFTQITNVTERFGGVAITFTRENLALAGTDKFAGEPAFATVTTDATGAYDLPVLPGLQRYKLTWNDPTALYCTPAGSCQRDSIMYSRKLSAIVTPRVNPTVIADSSSTAANGGPRPNTDLTKNLLYQFRSRITGTVFRDINDDSVRAAGTTENVIATDGPRILLKDAAGTHVIATATATAGTGAYTFASVVPGTYKITLDLINSTFPTNPLTISPKQRTYTVVVTNAAATATMDYGVRVVP